MIENHIAPKLSDLDLEIISHIQPGGNWQDVPQSVPSLRLKQIRESYAAGKGSRSTYYGRLLANDPAYTISTYFTRPGNGCNIHYDQDRTISFREAARLQSFPDNFIFSGSKTAIARQIGNAVPPLFSYQIARSLPVKRAAFVDLFSGAGGLALGFVWAGWTPIISNDIDLSAVETHRKNFASPAIVGDISDESVQRSIVDATKEFRIKEPGTPIFVIGGPPCQGFSTANGGRSSSDMRNWLFKEYANLIRLINPDGFVFENVPGILNFERGRFFEMIKKDLKASVESIRVEKLNTADFAVPQRRNRVLVIGGLTEIVDNFELRRSSVAPNVVRRSLRGIAPDAKCASSAITAFEALSDLPGIDQGMDGTSLSYLKSPSSRYQKFLRGEILPSDFILRIR